MKFSIVICISLIIISCSNSQSEQNFDKMLTIKEHADTLKTLHELITKRGLEEREKKKYEKAFFYAFPNTFSRFEAVYGYDRRLGPSDLYEGHIDHLNTFANLNSVEIKTYLRKLIYISKDGKWDADAIGMLQHFMQENLRNNLDICVTILNELSEEETRGFWYFFYDGPHPDNYQDIYEPLYKNLNEKDPRIAGLMKQSYENLLSEQHCEGH